MGCIPVDKHFISELETTLLARAVQLGIEFRTINDEDLIQQKFKHYFYVQFPLPSKDDGTTTDCNFDFSYKQFLYISPDYEHDSSNAPPIIPIQFGREIVASVMGKPETI